MVKDGWARVGGRWRVGPQFLLPQKISNTILSCSGSFQTSCWMEPRVFTWQNILVPFFLPKDFLAQDFRNLSADRFTIQDGRGCPAKATTFSWRAVDKKNAHVLRINLSMKEMSAHLTHLHSKETATRWMAGLRPLSYIDLYRQFPWLNCVLVGLHAIAFALWLASVSQSAHENFLRLSGYQNSWQRPCTHATGASCNISSEVWWVYRTHWTLQSTSMVFWFTSFWWIKASLFGDKKITLQVLKAQHWDAHWLCLCTRGAFWLSWN